MRNDTMASLTLIQSPLQLDTMPVPHVGALPPLGLLALATYVEERHTIPIHIIDADYLGLAAAQEALRRTPADVVGIGIQASESYSSALVLAQTAKQMGAIVVLGGEQATLRAPQILENRSYIDYVVAGQGEAAMTEILQGAAPHQIPNLVYRNHGKVTQTPKMRINQAHLPIPQRIYVDLAAYAHQFQETLEAKLTGKHSFTTAKTQDFCLKAVKKGICSFCKREDLFGPGIRNPKQFWEEMMYLQNLGVDYVWDVSPSFSSVGLPYLQKLAAAKPASSIIAFRIYGRADDLADERIVAVLREIGVENILVGFDSGNQVCLDSSNKGTTIDQHRQAAKHLRAYDIATYSAFVLGHMAETYESMRNTLDHARELKGVLGDRLFRITTCSKMQLYPGTGEYQRFLSTRPELREALDHKDMIDIHTLSEAYFREFLRIDPTAADETAEEIRRLSPIRSGKDMKALVH